MHKNTLRVFSYMTSGALFAVSTLQAQVSVKDTQTAYGREITLANEFISASFLPDWGGRMNKLVDLKSGVNMVFWDYPPDHPKWNHGWGGALDDKCAPDVHYAYSVATQTADEVSIALESPPAEKIRKKIITLRAGRPSLQVEYHYFNKSQKATAGSEFTIRNFFQPGGGSIDWQYERAFVPTVKTVRELGVSALPEELQGKFQTEVIPTWNGFIDRKSGRGLAFSFQDDFYRWFYRWIKSETATYEWTYSPLAPGKEAVTRFSIAVTRGLEGYTDVAEKYALHLIWKQEEGKAKVACRLFPTLINLGSVVVKSELLSPDRKPLSGLSEIKIGAAKVGAIAEGSAVWDIPAQAGSILVQKVYDGDVLLGEYELPVPPDAPSKEYVRPKQGRSPAMIKDIPGFTLENIGDIAQVSDADRKRGYLIYRDYFAPDEASRGKDTEAISLDLGREEFESLAVNVRILLETGPFRLSSNNERLAMYVQNDDEIPEAKSGGKEGIAAHMLNRTNSFAPAAGKDTTIWFVWDGRGLKPGVYTPAVTFTPDKGEPKTVSLRISTRDLAVPERSIMELEVEAYVFLVFAKMYNWDLSKVVPYIRDMGLHRVIVTGLFDGVEKNGFPPQFHPRIRATGEPFAATNAGPDTVLDLSGYDPWFDELIENGIVRVNSRQSGEKEMTREEQWRLREAARYLGEKGYPYRDRYVKFIDEQPPEVFPAMAKKGEQYHAAGWRVMHTTPVDKSDVQLAILNPTTDIWSGGLPDKEFRKKKVQEKLLDPEDEYNTYDGYGASWKSYANRRSMPWVCSVNDLNTLHLHTYYRQARLGEDLIRVTPEGPVGSAAWEGARDGIEDVQYFEMARQWLGNLAKNGVEDATLKALREKIASLTETMQGTLGGERSYQQLLEAKQECFAVLEALKPYRNKITISVRHGFEPLALDGKPRYVLAGETAATAFLCEELTRRAGIRFQSAAWDEMKEADKGNQNVILLLTAGDKTVKEWAAAKRIELGPSYPAAGSYAVYQIPNPGNEKNRIILIVGGDAVGLKKGCRHFLRFLRIEPQPF